MVISVNKLFTCVGKTAMFFPLVMVLLVGCKVTNPFVPDDSGVKAGARAEAVAVLAVASAPGADYYKPDGPVNPDTPVSDDCVNCDGTGQVGDGRIMKTCLVCGGTGKKPKKAITEILPPGVCVPGDLDCVAPPTSSGGFTPANAALADLIASKVDSVLKPSFKDLSDKTQEHSSKLDDLRKQLQYTGPKPVPATAAAPADSVTSYQTDRLPPTPEAAGLVVFLYKNSADHSKSYHVDRPKLPANWSVSYAFYPPTAFVAGGTPKYAIKTATKTFVLEDYKTPEELVASVLE